VIGRRDSATGELCVGSTLQPTPDAPNFEGFVEKVPSYVEIVTGPEAERLILAVHRWLSEQANEPAPAKL